jgi:hypothetical protein
MVIRAATAGKQAFLNHTEGTICRIPARGSAVVPLLAIALVDA